MATIEDEKKRLRQYLNPTIKGPNVDSVLESLATGTSHLINNVEAVNDSLYIVTAQGKYLDARLADKNLTRPENVGLSDEVFRQIGIEVSARKQVRDLILSILGIVYGEEFTKATMNSTEFEPYQLENGDSLMIQFDDEEKVEVFFDSSQFASINAATAQEVADTITKEIRRLGRRGSAVAKNDGVGGYVMLMSETLGPSSTVKVVGGKAQNKLKFPSIRPTSGLASTQWKLELVAGGLVRATWIGGADPSVGKVKKNDYVNIYGSSFDSYNRGTFTVVNVNGGLAGEAYFEFINPSGVPETKAQGISEGVLFFNPIRNTINSKTTFATLYQTESRLLEVFMPATTKVVRRERIGSAHLHESGASASDELGPYIFDVTKPYVIGQEECNTTTQVDSGTGIIVNVDNSANIPDQSGFLVFGFGTSLEEGPVPYIARPSSNSIMINPSYKFKNVHASGTNISLVAQNYAYDVARDGSDYAFYITDVVAGRVYAEDLIKLVYATGIKLVITILYPNDIGLGKYGTENSEKVVIWGE